MAKTVMFMYLWKLLRYASLLVASLVFGACNGGTNTDPCEGVTCSEHGTCGVSNDEAICACDEGYKGELCEGCGEGYHNEGGECLANETCEVDTCSGHGSCDDSTGVATCDCGEGYDGEQCAECAEGYHDEDGSCLVNEVCGPDSCSGHGTCDDSNGVVACDCDTGWDGAACDACSAGYHDEEGNCVANTYCQVDTCSGHGSCDDSSGTQVCTCDTGWGGLDCSVELFGVEWVVIPGGTFMMGSDTGEADEQPVHQVTVPAFDILRTEVTVAQYQECVDAGACTEPLDYTVYPYCNWGLAWQENHPVNCVNWIQASDFCIWAGGRLPTEAEWEHAARSGGQEITYPWGDDPASCTYAVMDEVFGDGVNGCGTDRTWAVCSKPAGNTEQGLCDMAGNVYEWVQDWYHSDFNGAPSDGSAWESPSGSYRVIRGGSYDFYANNLRAANRDRNEPFVNGIDFGLRCARDVL